MGLWIFGYPPPQAHWQPSPDGRGTSDILQTCIITLGLCVYTCLHLNIPAHGLSKWRKFARKATWMLLALLAPEIVVYLAWAQRRRAKDILTTLCRAKGVDRPWPWHTRLWRRMFGTGAEPTYHTNDLAVEPGDPAYVAADASDGPYTMVHGFFFSMGGLAFDLSKDQHPVLPEDMHRWVLHPDLLQWLLDHGYHSFLPRLTVEDIKDKSKADGLVKMFTCIQSLWFCLQVVTRFAQRLPITLLELNTFAHAVCALLVYLLWWEKPLDVTEPIWRRGDQDEQAEHPAYLKDSTSGGSPAESLKFLRDSEIFASTSVLGFQNESYFRDDPWSQGYDRIHASRRRTNADKAIPTSISQDRSVTHLERGDQVPGLPFTVGVGSVEIDEAILIRLRYLMEPHGFIGTPSDGLCDSVSDFSDLLYSKNRSGKNNAFAVRLEESCRSLLIEGYQIVVLAMSGLAYGGLHMLAWGTTFPTHTESLLWAVSALTILCFVPASIVAIGIYDVIWKSPVLLWKFLVKNVRSLIGRLSQSHDIQNAVDKEAQETPLKTDWENDLYLLEVAFPDYFAVLSYVFYVACRVFIVVEVFLALPYSDLAVFQTPNWTLYFPHIGS